jgi:hypothetical protein
VPSSSLAAGRRAHVVRALAAITLAVGFVDLVRGGVTLAPLLLVSGYVVLVPIALITE